MQVSAKAVFLRSSWELQHQKVLLTLAFQINWAFDIFLLWRPFLHHPSAYSNIWILTSTMVSTWKPKIWPTQQQPVKNIPCSAAPKLFILRQIINFMPHNFGTEEGGPKCEKNWRDQCRMVGGKTMWSCHGSNGRSTYFFT